MSLSLHDVLVAERPRERLLRLGPEALAAAELVAVLLGQGYKTRPVMQVAAELVQRYGGLMGLAEAGAEELLAVKGLGPAKVCQLLASLELAKRVGRESKERRERRPVVQRAERLAELIRDKIDNPQQEHFWVVSLSSRNHVLGIDLISTGTVDAALVHPRETFAAAIRRMAAKVIVGHNHPSGDAAPSEDDLLITKRLQTAGKIMGIELIDHLIVTSDGFYSLQRQGQLKGSN